MFQQCTQRGQQEHFYCPFGKLTTQHVNSLSIYLSESNQYISANLENSNYIRNCQLFCDIVHTKKVFKKCNIPNNFQISLLWCLTITSLSAVFHCNVLFNQFLIVSRFLWNQRTFFCTLSRATWEALSWDACSLMDSKNDCTWGSNT